MIRDMAMMCDHQNFMSFDINDEKDALQKLFAFARYVISPLNPILQDRLQHITFMKQVHGNEESKGEGSNHGSNQEGASSGNVSLKSSVNYSSLQRAARKTLMNYANSRKASFNY